MYAIVASTLYRLVYNTIAVLSKLAHSLHLSNSESFRSICLSLRQSEQFTTP